MAADVLHDDDPNRDGNLTAEEYAARARKRAEDGGPCHPAMPDDSWELDQ